MQVTDLSLIPAQKDDPFIATVIVTLDEEIIIGGIHLYGDMEDAVVLIYPSVDLSDGSKQEIAYPVSEELREDIYLKAVAAFAAKNNKMPLPEKI